MQLVLHGILEKLRKKLIKIFICAVREESVIIFFLLIVQFVPDKWLISRAHSMNIAMDVLKMASHWICRWFSLVLSLIISILKLFSIDFSTSHFFFHLNFFLFSSLIGLERYNHAHKNSNVCVLSEYLISENFQSCDLSYALKCKLSLLILKSIFQYFSIIIGEYFWNFKTVKNIFNWKFGLFLSSNKIFRLICRFVGVKNVLWSWQLMKIYSLWYLFD